jgi:hypothetical protein
MVVRQSKIKDLSRNKLGGALVCVSHQFGAARPNIGKRAVSARQKQGASAHGRVYIEPMPSSLTPTA